MFHENDSQAGLSEVEWSHLIEIAFIMIGLDIVLSRQSEI